MPDRRTPGRGAIMLLLDVLETPKASIAGIAARQFNREIAELASAQLIKPSGHMTAGADDDDRPREFVWCPDSSSYGYFSEAEGWAPVPESDIASFAVDLTRFLSVVTGKFRLSGMATSMSEPTGGLWNLGSARFGRRPRRNPVMFARRMHNASVCNAVESAVRRQGNAERMVLLTTTQAELVPAFPRSCEVVSLWDVVDFEKDLLIDPNRIAARLSQRPLAGEGDLQVIADGKLVKFFGETFRFERGVKQREIIRYLFKEYQNGRLLVSSAQIVAELDYPPQTRIRDIFKNSPAWSKLLAEQNGMCGFCLDRERSGGPDGG